MSDKNISGTSSSIYMKWIKENWVYLTFILMNIIIFLALFFLILYVFKNINLGLNNLMCKMPDAKTEDIYKLSIDFMHMYWVWIIAILSVTLFILPLTAAKWVKQCEKEFKELKKEMTDQLKEVKQYAREVKKSAQEVKDGRFGYSYEFLIESVNNTKSFANDPIAFFEKISDFKDFENLFKKEHKVSEIDINCAINLTRTNKVIYENLRKIREEMRSQKTLK